MVESDQKGCQQLHVGVDEYFWLAIVQHAVLVAAANYVYEHETIV